MRQSFFCTNGAASRGPAERGGPEARTSHFAEQNAWRQGEFISPAQIK